MNQKINLEDKGIEIDSRVIGVDFDDADKEIINQMIKEANQSDEDEESAIRFGY